MASRPSLGIVAQRATEIWTDRHQPRLVEFRVADGQQCRRQIDVGERQAERFAEAQARSVQQQQERSKRVGFEVKSTMPIAVRRLQQAAHLVTRKEIRHKRRWLFRDDGRQRGVRDESVTHGIAIESTQRRMLSVPVARHRPAAVDEGTDSLNRNVGDRDVWTDGTTKRVQQSRSGTKIRPGGLAEDDVLGDGLVCGRHRSPVRSKSATCLRPTRSTFAY